MARTIPAKAMAPGTTQKVSFNTSTAFLRRAFTFSNLLDTG
jgi:hypothetical protein